MGTSNTSRQQRNDTSAFKRLEDAGLYSPRTRQPQHQLVVAPVSLEQLIAIVKAIYASLVIVEAKCCQVDSKLMADEAHRLGSAQWEALIALHRTLLQEHHDFFVASQHPNASPNLRKLVLKNHMPVRMWRHGIHSFLELLRQRLPHSMEHMLTFFSIAYGMVTQLYETFPAFEDTWNECLGDLGRYRMAIAVNDSDRHLWADFARVWYSKAADKTPYIGRLHHHLAVLAYPNVLQQLFLYHKSLGVSQPFASARESILTLSKSNSVSQSALVDTGFIQLHEINFTQIHLEEFDQTLCNFLLTLRAHVSGSMSKWMVSGGYIAVCNIIGLYQYGAKDGLLQQAWNQGLEDVPTLVTTLVTPAENDSLLPPVSNEASAEYDISLSQQCSAPEPDQKSRGVTAQEIHFNCSKRLAYRILEIALERVGDPDVLPHVHIWLVFVMYIKTSRPATRLLENGFPWDSLVAMLNILIESFGGEGFEGEMFPVPVKGVRPLPEDYALRGLDWSSLYFPERWFDDADDERLLGLPSIANIRVERILWLATRIAALGDYLGFKNRTFSVSPSLLQRIEGSGHTLSE